MAKIPVPIDLVDARGLRIAFVTSEFNRDITDAMRDNGHAEARRLGATIAVDVRAPGVYDIPLIAETILRRDDVDALVALGAVITGETQHDQIVTHNAARLLADLAISHRKPVGLGITGPGQTKAQAQARVDRAAWAVQSVSKQFRTLRELEAADAGTRRAANTRLR
jgi:6,7-dimethyl-8-ribityllumazine synthase